MIGLPWVKCSHWSNQVQLLGTVASSQSGANGPAALTVFSDLVVVGPQHSCLVFPRLGSKIKSLSGNDTLPQGHRSFYSFLSLSERAQGVIWSHGSSPQAHSPLGLPPPPSQHCPRVPWPRRQMSKSRC